jgi:(p)ppGpp synthase/HD superfamily hydrolase
MEGENTWGVIYALKNGKDIGEYRPVEIFTPTGGARFLPEGSSVLDAIATIQQEFLLDKISGVKVNGNLAMLSEKVKPGDLVEVVTSTTRIPPDSSWLKIVNPATARILRSVLAVEDLRQAAENGKQKLRNVLHERGILALEDVQALYPERIDQLLETTSAANLQDMYAAIGSGAIRIVDIAKDLDELGISKAELNWTTINIQSGSYANRPGVLAKLAGLISDSGGNIVRSVNNTMPDGGCYLRLVVENINAIRHDKEPFKKQASEISGINIKDTESVP